MMKNPHSKAELIAEISHVQTALTESVKGMADDQFTKGSREAWSAADYLKHLILSVKPFAKGLRLPAEELRKLFGEAENGSKTYEEVVATYKARLADGIRAEDFEAVTPVVFRMPEGIENLKDYLLEVWNDSNQRLLGALQNWEEGDLDSHQIPHPALGLITIREMVFFTLYHNTLHWHDIQQAGR